MSGESNITQKIVLTHEDVWRGIEIFAHEHNMSCSGLAKIAGLDPTTFNKSKRFSKEGQPRWPSTLSVAKILNATGSGLLELLRYVQNNSSSKCYN
ncbi:MAG TPA: hypothetical protein PKJ33_04265 [Alphaproteobacteria bacterium]|nr:hypothetical protein [Alphaproteobacteria bacterium]